jgi:ABC-2 type transport system ATP-binding protein
MHAPASPQYLSRTEKNLAGFGPMSEGAPGLSVDQLTKRFGERVAFEAVSLEVGRGEVFGFLGPNGAGKTTMVRTLGTLIAPTSGSASVAGLSLAPENGVEIRRRISIMPESPGLYLRLSVGRTWSASPCSTR